MKNESFNGRMSLGLFALNKYLALSDRYRVISGCLLLLETGAGMWIDI